MDMDLGKVMLVLYPDLQNFQELIPPESCRREPRVRGDPNLFCLNKFLLKSPMNTPRPQAQNPVRKGTKRGMRTHANEEERKAVRHVNNSSSVFGACKKKKE